MASTKYPNLRAKDYSFVVFGVCTARLVTPCLRSEDPNLCLLALEAGDNYLEDPRIDIPSWSALLGSEEDGTFETTPQVIGLTCGISIFVHLAKFEGHFQRTYSPSSAVETPWRAQCN